MPADPVRTESEEYSECHVRVLSPPIILGMNSCAVL
jgi:hypothetical protein